MITMTYKDLLLAILLICAIAVAVYLIVLIRKLMPVVQNLSQITEDAKGITKEAKESIGDIKKVVSETEAGAAKLNSSVKTVCKLIDGNKNTVNAITNLTNAAAGLINLLKK